MNTQLTPAVHSTLGASIAERWCACPGSVRLSQGIESPQSEYAREGTEAHEAAAFRLTKKGWPYGISDEMQDAAKVYVDLVEKELAEDKNAILFVEQRLDLSSIHPKMFGTADAVIYFPSKKLLRVYDYKHGKGVPVDVKDNVQLQYYGLGALLKLNMPCDTVELIVVQPRCFHPDGPIRRWALPAFDMLDFAADLKDYATKTEDPNAPLSPGDHCRWCPAAPVCPALLAKAQEVAKSEFSPANTYDPNKLSAVLKWLDIVEEWATSVRTFAYNEAQKGRLPPGFKLVAKQARKKWKAGVDAEVLGKKFGYASHAFLDYSLLSPAGVEKVLTKREHRDALAEFYTKESSGTVLAPESDPREPIKLDAQSEFKALVDGTGETQDLDIFS